MIRPTKERHRQILSVIKKNSTRGQFCGYLKYLETPNQWNDYFFVLNNSNLLGYSDQDSKLYNFLIDLSNVHIKVSLNQENTIEIIGCSKIYFLKASNYIEVSIWIQHLISISLIYDENNLIHKCENLITDYQLKKI